MEELEPENKMMFVGDPHGLYQHIIDDIQLHCPTACVLLGDQCYDQAIDQLFADIDAKTALRWIHGNHDTDRPGWYANLFDSPWRKRNIHGRVEQFSLESGSLRLAGLGGVFRGKIWNPKGGEPSYQKRTVWKHQHNSKRYAQNERKHESSIWPEDYDRLAMNKADILVLHEAPTSDMHGYQVLDELAEMLGVCLVVHGHHHRQYTATLENGIAVVGLGLAQVAMLDLDAFAQAGSANDIFAAFQFGKRATRDGGWLY